MTKKRSPSIGAGDRPRERRRPVETASPLSRTLAATSLIRPAFPRVLSPRAAIIKDVAHQLSELERIPWAEQSRGLQTQLISLARHAYRYSPFWRERLAGAGFREDNSEPTFFSVLPPLSRKDLQDHFTSLRARPPELPSDAISLAQTSGSTGQPVRVEKLRALYDCMYQAVELINSRWHGHNGRQKLAVIRDAPDTSQIGWNSVFAEFGLFGPCVARNMIEHDPKDLLEWLASEGAQYLLTSPTMAVRLAELALDQELDLRFAQVITFGEVVTPDIREICSRAFGAKVVDRYSCEEVGWIALQCSIHDHYHVVSGTTIVEIVDDSGKPCAVGQPGRVLITSLHSYAMPILRYEIGDYAEWGRPCDCGVTLPVIARIWGRKRNFLRLPNGQLRFARLTGDHWRSIAPVREYRIVQYADCSIEAFVRCDRPFSEHQRSAAKVMLQRVLGHPFEIIITETEVIDWGGGRKREDFVSLERLREEA